MNFLHPEVLSYLPLAGLPILIHLLNRRRYNKVEFGAMDFLRQAIRKQRRRILLENWLLLFLRTLAVLALIVALANPQTSGNHLGQTRTARSEVFILDASASMRWKAEGSTPWKRAINATLQSLKSLSSTTGDQVALILADNHPRRLSFGSPEALRSVLQELEGPSFSQANLSRAFYLAHQTALELENLGLPCQITVLSDYQASTWDLPGTLQETLLRLQEENRTWLPVDVGRTQPQTALTDLRLTPASMPAGESTWIQGTVRRFGPETETKLTLFVDDRPQESQTVFLKEQEEKVVSFFFTGAEEGLRKIRLQLETDAFPTDDRRYAILEVRPPHVLGVLGESVADDQETLVSLRRYFSLGEEAPFHWQSLSGTSLTRAYLMALDILLVFGPGPQTLQALPEIQNWVSQGGHLLFIPEENQNPTSFLSAFQADSIHIGPAKESKTSAASLFLNQPEHPGLALFRDPRWRPLLTEIPFQRWLPIKIEGDPSPFQVPLAFEHEETREAAWVEWSFQHGQCAILTAVPQKDYNLMEQVPGGTLPLLYDLLRDLGSTQSNPRELLCGEEYALHFPQPPSAVHLISPEGARHQIGTPLSTPGIWSASAQLPQPEGGEILWEERAAVHAPKEESFPAKADLLQLDSFQNLSDKPQSHPQTDSTSEESSGNTPPFSPWFFLLVFFALVFESILAARLDRRRA